MGITTRSAVMWPEADSWEITELDLDEPRAGEVLIRLEVSGLCHSDDHLRTRDSPARYPIVGGHEGAGVVEAVGDGVTRVAVGSRVVCSFVPVCGTCRACVAGLGNLCEGGAQAQVGGRPDGTFRWHARGEDIGGFCGLGTFSDRAVVSENSLVPLDDDISFEIGALLACGVPTGYGSAVYAAGVRPGESVVVYGSGGVGINAVQGAALSGAWPVVVVDPVQFKRDTALKLGASHVFATHDEAIGFVHGHSYGRMADHAIITVGVNNSEVFDQAMAITGKRSTIIVTAVGNREEKQVVASGDWLLGYEKTIRGALCGSCHPMRDLPILMELYRSGRLRLDELITRRYSLDQLNDGYRDLLGGRNIRGVIVHS